MITPSEETPDIAGRPVSVRLTAALRDELKRAAKRTGLPRAALLRLACERGLPVLLEQLQRKTEAPAA